MSLYQRRLQHFSAPIAAPYLLMPIIFVRLSVKGKRLTGVELRGESHQHSVIIRLILTAGSVRIADRYRLIRNFFANQSN